MRQARGLLPYAGFALFVVGATVVALVLTTLRGPATVPDAPPASPSAAPTVARTATDLSATGRLAYWRTEPNGDHLLWLASADNSRRRSVAKTDQPGSISRTRWSTDGSAVGYIESGVRLVVVRVDGVTTSYTLAPELRTDGSRIVDHRSSPGGSRIAATVQRQSGSQSDVYVTAAGSGTWTRLTTTEDVLAADWLSEDELLVQTTGGIVGRLRASGRDQMRPITGLVGGTPIIGDDGRVSLLSGRVAPFTMGGETVVFTSMATVYSLTVDGEDLRADAIALAGDAYRLDGVWPGGAYLLHRGTNPAQVLIGKGGPVELPPSAGVVERLEVSADHRYAIGFAGSNVVRFDLGPTGAIANAVVLLGSVGEGDAWFPRTATLARVAPAAVDVPAARYVFALGGHLWTMGPDGAPTLLRAGNAFRRSTQLPIPRWSPAGDRILTLESLIPGSPSFQLIAVTIGRDGTARRYTTPPSIGTTLSWSPDGTRFAVTSLFYPATDPSVLVSDLSIALVDASSGAAGQTLPGREAYWTQAGIVVLSNGTFRGGDRARDGQAIELVAGGGEKRTVSTIAKLVGDPRVQAPAESRGITQTYGLTASPDGAYAAIHLAFLSGGVGSQPAFAIVATRDGQATTVVARDSVADESWSPTGHRIGYTLNAFVTGSGFRPRAVVRDAETGDVLIDGDGRFAGWSPDGAWAYIARPEGLFARRLAGGDPVRVSPYGVPVAVTRP